MTNVFRKTGALELFLPSDREIAIKRAFDAPRRLVFEALSKCELLKRWFAGPPGWTLVECEVDLRVGGRYRFVWHGPDGARMGMGGTYREVVPPERYVNTEKFDEAWYEGEALVTTTLVEQAGKTTVNLTIRYESQDVRDAVLKFPMDQGVAAGYDKLAALLASLLAEEAK